MNATVELLYEECLQNATNLTNEYDSLLASYSACGCGVDPCAIGGGDYGKSLHVAAIFIILVASALGAAFPIVAKSFPQLKISAYGLCLGKHMGTGVVLACGFVHMLQPSNGSLTSACVPWEFNTDYTAYAYLFAMIAGLMMFFSEFMFGRYLERTRNGKVVVEAAKDSVEMTSPGLVGDGATESSSTGHGHSHSALIELHAEEWSTKKLIEAYLIEFGVTVHSLFVGLAVGVVALSDLKALLIALVFHQFFEGIALGSRIADTDMSVLNEFLLSSLFSVAAPIGIAVGVGVYTTLNTNGEKFLMVQGTFDGICAGILIYIGFSLLLIDFPRDILKHCKGARKSRMQAGFFFALWLGAGLMAFIGKYL